VAEKELESATQRAVLAIQRTLADETGQWILRPHAEAASELSLTGIVDGKIRYFQLDRTFVDDEGFRWIVDYKTSSHEGGATEAFLDQEQREYQKQLEDYAVLMRHYDPEHPIRLGLYFPLIQGWRKWDAPV